MNATLKWITSETLRILGQRLGLAGGLACLLVLPFLAGCISLDKQFAKQADLYMRTTGDAAVAVYLDKGGLDEDARGDVTFQTDQFKETIRKALEE